MGKVEIAAQELEQINARFETAHPREICAWAAEKFGDGLVMTSSFGADSMCTVHLATQVKPDVRIIVVNTGFLFSETLAFMEEMRLRFRLNIVEYRTKNEPLVWLSVNGEPDPRVRKNVDACCAANKNEVMDRAMREQAPLGWIRGVRRTTAEREKMRYVQWSERYQTWSVQPILRWSSRDVFQYMKENNLPHHPMWEKGYTSIGCNPETCTRPVMAGEDERAGRWSGSEKKECGINLDTAADI